MLGPEATPFASTGGLGEVLQGLPIALARAGHEVAVLLPYYPQVRAFSPQHTHRTLNITLGSHYFLADVYETEVQRVHYFFLDIPALYQRPGMYSEGVFDFPDNHLRFGALARGALATAETLFSPAIIHCHDWPTGLLPVLLREALGTHPAFATIKTVFTIHNLAFQGRFPREAVADLGLDRHFKSSAALYPDGSINFMKGALATCDAITTVSPTYAAEIQTPEAGCGLEELIASRGNVLTGILNGIDSALWDPATDPHLPAHFSPAALAGKRACKLALLQQAGLSVDRIDKPLIGVVARLTPQKGFQLLTRNPKDFLALDFSLVLLGSGDPHEEDFFRWLASSNPSRISVQIGYSAQYAHRILAGSDLFLMPSRYEPCGLTQLYAMRFGTLPLVHATGGLKDTVSADTGFSFVPYTAEALLSCLRQALALWHTPQWSQMQAAAMQKETSWTKPAAAYSALYAKLLAAKT
jgi:starch synthase